MTRIARGALGTVFLTAALASSCEDDPAAPGGGGGPDGAGEAELDPIASGLFAPTDLAFPPDAPRARGASRFFVTERSGKVRVVENGTVLTAPLLDLGPAVGTNGEQGLLSLALDPGFSFNRWFYVFYVTPQRVTTIARYAVSAGDPNAADPDGETILTVNGNDIVHYGGRLAFDDEGYLYVSLGDGRGPGGGDPAGNGQNTATLMGSILRLDVSAGGTGYTIPASNPFVGSPPAREEIWCHGLRNPWRYSFDLLTGDLYVADVGRSRREEVTVLPVANGRGRGANLGWNVVEGDLCHEPSEGCDTSGFTPPTLTYAHGKTTCHAIVGGFVYRGAAVPALAGRYLYADYCAQFVRSFRYEGGVATDDRLELTTTELILSFAEDPFGEIYLLTQSGTVYRIVAP